MWGISVQENRRQGQTPMEPGAQQGGSEAWKPTATTSPAPFDGPGPFPGPDCHQGHTRTDPDTLQAGILGPENLPQPPRQPLSPAPGHFQGQPATEATHEPSRTHSRWGFWGLRKCRNHFASSSRGPRAISRARTPAIHVRSRMYCRRGFWGLRICRNHVENPSWRPQASFRARTLLLARRLRLRWDGWSRCRLAP